MPRFYPVNTARDGRYIIYVYNVCMCVCARECACVLYNIFNLVFSAQVRERLRIAQKRNTVLEDELMLANQEVRS